MPRSDRPGARALLERVLDPGSWTSWDSPAQQPAGMGEQYARPDAGDEPDAFLRRLGHVLEHELVVLLREDDEQRLEDRLRRYRSLGSR